ncbi:MAG TPA: hypothetical protein VI078_01585 [bacterium]
MKRIVGMILIAALLVAWGPRPAVAGSAARHRWQGAAIALGALGLLAVIGDAAQAQPVAVGVGVGVPVPIYPAPVYCPPPPPPPVYVPAPPTRYWVPGYWDYVDVWVPAAIVIGATWGGWGDHDDRYRGYARGGRHDHGRYGYDAGRGRGHYERRRVWREGHYR